MVRLVPGAYLEYKSALLNECNKQGGLRLAQARALIKIDVNKTRKIYDFLIREGHITKAWGSKGREQRSQVWSVIGQRTAGHSGVSFLSWILIVERGEEQRKPWVVFMSTFSSALLPDTPVAGIVPRSYVLDKLLLIVCGHSFLTPLVTKTSTIVPHITVLVEIELNLSFVPGAQLRSLYLLGRLVFWLSVLPADVTDRLKIKRKVIEHEKAFSFCLRIFF